MPRVIWDQAAFNAFYQRWNPATGQYEPSYTRNYQGSLNRAVDTWAKLVSLFPIQITDRVLIAGCAFGWTIEAAHAAGFVNVFGIDNSSYIDSNAPTESDGGVVFVRDSFTGGGRIRNELRQATGDDIFTWVISESVLESYDDAEIPALLDAAEAVLDPSQPLTNIIHLVVCLDETVDPPGSNQDPIFNWKTLAEWKTMRSSHTWVKINNGWEVM